jgi:hypothetical protein
MVVAGLAIFALSLSLLMVPYSSVIEESGGKDLTCLQIPYTKARAAAIIDSYNNEARSAARALHLPGDLLIVRQQEGRWLRVGLIVMFFPFVAMVLDWVENAFILRMLTIATEQSTDAIPAWMPVVGGLVGTLKYLFLSLLAPIFGIALIVRSLVARQPALTVGLGLTYLIAFFMFAFSLFQLFTDVVPCLGPAS